MAIDLRNYKANALAQIAQERERDDLWSWRLAAANKGSVRVRWSYFDYIGERDDIVVTAGEDEDCKWVKAKVPSGHVEYIFVGPNHWDDVNDMGKAVEMAIRGAARYCHNCY